MPFDPLMENENENEEMSNAGQLLDDHRIVDDFSPDSNIVEETLSASTSIRARSVVEKHSCCLVCGDKFFGRRFGVSSCQACTSFFHYNHTKEAQLKCKSGNEDCTVSITTRGNCAHCRLQKCFRLGMKKAEESSAVGGMRLNAEKPKCCLVCGDKFFGIRFGVPVCAECNHFFNGNHTKQAQLKCKFGNADCMVSITTRDDCANCRLQKCFRLGMKKAEESSAVRDANMVTDTLSTNSSSRDHNVAENQKLCLICGDKRYSRRFGVLACYPCTKFFYTRHGHESQLKCTANNGNCIIDIVTRSNCSCCRLQKCMSLGMKFSDKLSVSSFSCSWCDKSCKSADGLKQHTERFCKNAPQGREQNSDGSVIDERDATVGSENSNDNEESGSNNRRSSDVQSADSLDAPPTLELEIDVESNQLDYNHDDADGKVETGNGEWSSDEEECILNGGIMRERSSDIIRKPKVAETPKKCLVCGDKYGNSRYGAPSCYPCNTFFARRHQDEPLLSCSATNNTCVISVKTRTKCSFCRLQKCLRLGMKVTEESLGVRVNMPRGLLGSDDDPDLWDSDATIDSESEDDDGDVQKNKNRRSARVKELMSSKKKMDAAHPSHNLRSRSAVSGRDAISKSVIDKGGDDVAKSNNDSPASKETDPTTTATRNSLATRIMRASRRAGRESMNVIHDRDLLSQALTASDYDAPANIKTNGVSKENSETTRENQDNNGKAKELSQCQDDRKTPSTSARTGLKRESVRADMRSSDHEEQQAKKQKMTRPDSVIEDVPPLEDHQDVGDAEIEVIPHHSKKGGLAAQVKQERHDTQFPDFDPRDFSFEDHHPPVESKPQNIQFGEVQVAPNQNFVQFAPVQHQPAEQSYLKWDSEQVLAWARSFVRDPNHMDFLREKQFTGLSIRKICSSGDWEILKIPYNLYTELEYNFSLLQ